MTPMREIYTVTLYTDNIFDSIPSGKLFSKMSAAWTILNDSFTPEQFLDISPHDQVVDIFRGRWLIVRKSLESFNVSGNNEIVTQHKMYIYDTYTSRVNECDRLPEGRYIDANIGTNMGARDLVTGEIFNSSLLTNFEMIDIEPIDTVPSQMIRSRNSLSGTPILSTTTPTPSSTTTADQRFIYVLKPRSKIREYSVYVGPQWGKGVKLSPLLTVSNYWHVAWPWIAYGHQVDNLSDAKKNIKLDPTKLVSGITLHLSDVYFVSVNTLVVVYESQNYQAIISVNL